MFNGVFQGVVASSANRAVSFCPEYQNVINYATIQGYTLPTLAQQIQQNQLMEYITGSGIFTELDVFYTFRNNGSSQFSLINWINTGSYYAVPAGAPPPTWDSTNGWIGNGTAGYIDTGYTPTGTSPQKFLQTDGSAFVYSTPNTPSLNSLGGYSGSGAGTLTLRINGNNAAQNRIMTNLGTSGNI
jgi:hypothetical protein